MKRAALEIAMRSSLSIDTVRAIDCDTDKYQERASEFDDSFASPRCPSTSAAWQPHSYTTSDRSEHAGVRLC
jgi:hypothetical protein